MRDRLRTVLNTIQTSVARSRANHIGLSLKPFVERINDKATKKYKMEGAPVDLVLHFDLRSGTATTVKRLVEKHETLLDSLTTTGPFETVWIFDDHAKTVGARGRRWTPLGVIGGRRYIDTGKRDRGRFGPGQALTHPV